jgi:hypothetical protein
MFRFGVLCLTMIQNMLKLWKQVNRKRHLLAVDLFGALYFIPAVGAPPRNSVGRPGS